MARGRYKDKTDWEEKGAKRVNPHQAMEYQPVFATVATILNAAGMSEKNIARKLGTSYTNFRKWKREHSDLKHALKNCKELVLTELIDTGLQVARGLAKTKDKTTEYLAVIDEDGNEKILTDDKGKQVVKVREVEKNIPPNERLLMFLVSSLDRQLGRDAFQNKQYIEKKSTEEHIHKIDAESVSEQINRLSGNLRKYVESKQVEAEQKFLDEGD
jgi:hypothetical protein